MSDEVLILRVRYPRIKGVWRDIAILGNQTLADFNSAILDAFEWNDEGELFRFVIGDAEVEYASTDDTRSPHNTVLNDLNLTEEDPILYIYGDEQNQFSIRLIDTDEMESGGVYPDVIDEDGDPPPQY
jgi:hypothetical protein